jgi:hypothetical protein
MHTNPLKPLRKWAKEVRIRPPFLSNPLNAYSRTLAPGWPIPNTAMDVASVLDNTLLHELCHTNAGGDLDDRGFLLGPYGWTNCVGKLPEVALDNAGRSRLCS